MAETNQVPAVNDQQNRNATSFREHCRQMSIDWDELYRTRDRAVILVAVGEERQSAKHLGPRSFRLSNRKAASPADAAAFDHDLPLDYDVLAEVLRPSVVYRSRSGGIAEPSPGIGLGDRLDGRPLTPDVLTRDHPLMATQASERINGQEAYRRVKGDLAVLSGFLADSHKLLDSFAVYLERCSGHNGVPTYVGGSEISPDLQELVLNLLWGQQRHARVSELIRGLDLGDLGPKKGKVTLENSAPLVNAITAFRDAWVGNVDQFSSVKVGGGCGLYEAAQSSAPNKFIESFQKARSSFGALVGILNTPSIPQLILEWVVGELISSAAEDLAGSSAQVAELSAADRADLAEQAVLEGSSDAIAAPVRRPDAAERERVIGLLEAVTQAKIDEAMGQLPSFEGLTMEERESAEELAASIDLSDVEFPAPSDQLRDQLRGALQILIRSKVEAALFLAPGLTRDDVAKTARVDFQQTLMSVLISGTSAAGGVVDEAERLGTLWTSDGDVSGHLTTVIGALGRTLLEAVCSPEVERRLELATNIAESERLFSGQRSIPEIVAPVSPKPKLRGLPFTSKTVDMCVDAAADEVVKMTQAREEAQGALPAPEGDFSKQIDAAKRVAHEQRSQKKDEAKVKQEVYEVLARSGGSTNDETSPFPQLVEQCLQEKAEGMRLVYTAYGEGQPESVKNQTERLTLCNLIMLDPKVLQLGQKGGRLLQMLLDLTGTVSSGGDLRPFFRQHSLTKYFEQTELEGGRLGKLHKELETQGSKRFEELAEVISDAHGLRALCDGLSGAENAEVVVLHGTSDEFIKSLETQRTAPGALRGPLFRADTLKAKTAPAAFTSLHGHSLLVGRSALAAGSMTEEDVVHRLRGIQEPGGTARVVLPPVLFSGLPLPHQGNWRSPAQRALIAREWEDGDPLVSVVGPSIPFTAPWTEGEPFVPAGFALVLRTLDGNVELTIPQTLSNVPHDGKEIGRQHLLGRMVQDLEAALTQAIVGITAPAGTRSVVLDRPSLGADFFVYMLRLVEAAAISAGRSEEDAGIPLTKMIRSTNLEIDPVKRPFADLDDVLLRSTPFPLRIVDDHSSGRLVAGYLGSKVIWKAPLNPA